MMDRSGALPALVVYGIIAGALVLVGMVVFALTIQALLAGFLVLAGLVLLFFPHRLAAFGPMGKWIVPFALIGLGILVYSGMI